jgi:hypothetical protein
MLPKPTGTLRALICSKGGLSIIAESALGFAVGAPPAAFEALTGDKLETWEKLIRVHSGNRLYRTHLDITGTDQPATRCRRGQQPRIKNRRYRIGKTQDFACDVSLADTTDG